MRHKKNIRKIGRNKSHRKALIRNMAISFFEHAEIKTTEAKAKELQRTVEKIITLGKAGDMASYRRINSMLNHAPSIAKVKKLSEKCKDRSGGCTRIIKLSPRPGDNSRMAVIKLVQ
ncbi:MAG: 50S ribosomal protein L17 [Candidatus Omnitrophica bacterium]|nr:50S ribosomal protein L17 [Candidatus Omnitrophota bacterium]